MYTDVTTCPPWNIRKSLLQPRVPVPKGNDCGGVLKNKWERNYQLLCQFKKREGHCNVPPNHVEDDVKLGNWLDRQRRSKKKGIINSRRKSQLDKLGIVWSFPGH